MSILHDWRAEIAGEMHRAETDLAADIAGFETASAAAHTLRQTHAAAAEHVAAIQRHEPLSTLLFQHWNGMQRVLATADAQVRTARQRIETAKRRVLEMSDAIAQIDAVNPVAIEPPQVIKMTKSNLARPSERGTAKARPVVSTLDPQPADNLSPIGNSP